LQEIDDLGLNKNVSLPLAMMKPVSGKAPKEDESTVLKLMFIIRKKEFHQ